MNIYAPSRSFPAKVNRAVMPFRLKRNLNINLDRPLISFTFDDCPKSVVDDALPVLEKYGWQSSIYMAMGLCGTTNHLGLHMSESDVVAAYKSGHEIADHTFDHIDATTVSPELFSANIEKNQARMNALGLPLSQTFAYPFGQLDAGSKRVVHRKFKGARGIKSRIHRTSADLNQLNSNRLYSGQSFQDLMRDITKLTKNPGWLTIFTHDVRDNPSDFGCTVDEFKAVVEAVKNIDADVMTVIDAINVLEGKDG